MSKHTPGTWSAYRKNIDSEKFSVVDASGAIIAKIDATAITRVRRWNDAVLISAAPDLLRQLKAAERELTLLLDMYIPNPAAHSVARGIAEVSRAVIAKAEGR